MKFIFIIFAAISLLQNCNSQQKISTSNVNTATVAQQPVVLGDEQFELYVSKLKNKRVGLVANQTATIKGKHLLDTLISQGVTITKVFAPEHGFRGDVDRGKEFKEETDQKTGIPVIPLYGKNSKMPVELLNDIDVVIFDIQDVGARFFTYITAMHYVMKSCAEAGKKIIILDRPNPLGDYVDGPVRKAGFVSYVGLDPIPLVHGMTIGELAMMIKGENWLETTKVCDLEVIPVKNYNHSTRYEPLQKPSPNLTNYKAIRLYPSLCLFEGTNISVGRGTDFPFQVIGFPDKKFGSFSFTPIQKNGMESNPDNKDLICYGLDLRQAPDSIQFTLKYLIDFYKISNTGASFFTRRDFFNKLAGNDVLVQQIIDGKSEDEIRKSWQTDLDAFRLLRKKYLLYGE